MHPRLLAFAVSLTSYFLLINGNKTDSKSSDLGEVPLSLEEGVYRSFNSDIKARISRPSIVQKTHENKKFENNSTKDAKIYGPTIISRGMSVNNNTKYPYEDLNTDQPNGRFVNRNNCSAKESSTVSKQKLPKNMEVTIFSASGKEREYANDYVDVFGSSNPIYKPYMEFIGFQQNATATEKESMSDYLNTTDYEIQNDEKGQISLVNSNENMEKLSEEHTMIPKNDEDFDMEFETIFGDIIEDGDNHEPNVTDRQPKSVDLSLDVLRISAEKLSYKKHKSPGVKSAKLIAGKKMVSTEVRQSSSTTTSPYNYFRTSHILTSDAEISEEISVISRSDSRTPSQLELQDDWQGNASTHEAAVSRLGIDKTIYVLPSLIVELGEGNSLWFNPNVRQDLYYEVTNNLDSAVQIRFKVTDEKSILWRMDKYNVNLSPHGSTRVRLTIIPRVDVVSDRIIFNAIGAETVQKEAIVRVTKKYLSDTSSPLVDYSYTSDCTDLVLSECRKGTWTIKVSARDQDSGLMLLTTIPKGLHFPDGYTAGTTEEVTGYFSDSCCNADLQIIAVDTLNNRIVKQANAYSAPLSFWAIIAIVLACLIILVIIIAIVIYCVKKYKERQVGSFDLPTYMGRSRY